MARLKNTELGYYLPSFFKMHINTDYDLLSIKKMPLKDMTVLFHEYIHFLQDFTTFYGLNTIYVHSEYLHSVANRIYNMIMQKISFPLKIEDNKDNVLLNYNIVCLSQGDTKVSDTYIIKEIEEGNDNLDCIDSNQLINELPRVIINPNDNSRRFGAIAIMENMAYLMERLCSPSGCEESPDFPYRAAEFVADYFVKDFSKNSLMILALCDMSLQNSNPGACFVRIMKGIRDGYISFAQPEDIYDYFYSQITINAYGTRNTYIAEFKALLSVVQNSLKSYLCDIPMQEVYYRWIDNLVRFAIYWREQDRYFLLKMARQNDLSQNSCWEYAVYNVGTPLMVNNKGHHYKIPQYGLYMGMDVEFFQAIRQIELLFITGKTNCDMYNWCKNSPDVNINEFCKTSPWKRCSDNMLCPYVILWRNWGLKDNDIKE